jgi:hypothetical protein
MSLFNSYATDPDREKNGVVVIYPDLERGDPEAYRVRLARMSGRSSRYKKARERVMKPYAKFNPDDLSQDVIDRTGMEIFIEAVILCFETKVYEGAIVDPKLGTPNVGDWVKGVEVRQEDGTDVIVPATTENLFKALTAARPFADVLLSDASGADLYRVAQRQDASKNS